MGHHIGLPTGACHVPMPLEVMHLRHVNRMTRGDKCDPDRSRAFLVSTASNESRKVDFGSLVIRNVPGSLNAEVAITVSEGGRKHVREGGGVLKSIIDFGRLAHPAPLRKNGSTSGDQRVLTDGHVRQFRLVHEQIDTASSALSAAEVAAAVAYNTWLAEARLPASWQASLKENAHTLVVRAQRNDVCPTEKVWSSLMPI